ncbi:MAG: sigma-70 family RNA polymerase sigma factor [Eubacteriales bacterium]|nr:sigma-70 family RNA polymerase sigma factor [Eubacteriales bacterium]
MISHINCIKAHFREICTQLEQEPKWKRLSENMGMVWYLAEKYCIDYDEIEDYLSLGMIGMMKAISCYRPDEKVCFSTYASKCVKNEIYMYLRKHAKLRNEIPVDEMEKYLEICDKRSGENAVRFPKSYNLYGSHIEQEVHEEIMAAVQMLTAKEKQIIILRYGSMEAFGQKDSEIERKTRETHTQKEIAQMLGCSQSYVSRIEKRALQRLRKQL